MAASATKKVARSKKKKKKTAITKAYDGSTPLESPLQEAFVQNILRGLPQYKAYKKAGYSCIQKDNAITVNSTRLLKNERIQTRKVYLQKKRAEKAEISAQKVIKEIASIAFAKIRKNILTNQVKLQALDSLGKHFGIFEKDNSQKSLNLAILLQQAIKNKDADVIDAG